MSKTFVVPSMVPLPGRAKTNKLVRNSFGFAKVLLPLVSMVEFRNARVDSIASFWYYLAVQVQRAGGVDFFGISISV